MEFMAIYPGDLALTEPTMPIIDWMKARMVRHSVLIRKA